MTGYCDWSQPELAVFCNARNEDEKQTWELCRNRICKHISFLVKQVFLNVRPSQPCQARWTGVAGVAAFCYGLFQFNGLLGLLLKSAGREDEGEERGGQNGGRDDGAQAGQAGDADVWSSINAVGWGFSRFGICGLRFIFHHLLLIAIAFMSPRSLLSQSVGCGCVSLQ